MKGISVVLFFLTVVVAAPVAYGQRTPVEVSCNIKGRAKKLCSKVKKAIKQDGTWSQTKTGSRYEVFLHSAGLSIPCLGNDVVGASVTYNVFMDGLSARFPHHVSTFAFQMDERGRVLGFAAWAEAIVIDLNAVRNFFEANTLAASPEDIPAFELKAMPQLELFWQPWP